MSQYYNSEKKRGIFIPGAAMPYKISRSKIDLFLNCPRCFYLDRRLGTGRPPGFPFNLNSAVDALLKKEFDAHRAEQTQHPLMKAYNIDAVPYRHERIDEWRDSLRRGIQAVYAPANLLITGGVDDVWEANDGKLIIVDYKATSKPEAVSLDAPWQIGYKRQMEIYQWLFRQNGFTVADMGYFVYCNGTTDREAFDGKLEFDISVLPYKGDTKWIEAALMGIKICLESESIPPASEECDYCAYCAAVRKYTS